MSRLSRIINVGDLKFENPDKASGVKYPLRPGTTVTAVFTATTYFTKPADYEPNSRSWEPRPPGSSGWKALSGNERTMRQ